MKKYLVSSVLAVSMGWAAGFASQGLVAKAAIVKEHRITVEKNLGAAAASTFESFLAAQLCPLANAQFDVADCSVADFQEVGHPVFIMWKAGDPDAEPPVGGWWNVVAHPMRSGDWMVAE